MLVEQAQLLIQSCSLDADDPVGRNFPMAFDVTGVNKNKCVAASF